MFAFATMYDRGNRGIDRDSPKAFVLYHRAAELGYLRAMGPLAWMYEAGSGTKKDVAAVRKWYQKAADLGGEASIEWLRDHPEKK